MPCDARCGRECRCHCCRHRRQGNQSNISIIQAQRNVLKSAAGVGGDHIEASVGAVLDTAVFSVVGTCFGGLIGAAVDGISSGLVADAVSDGVLGMNQMEC